MKAVLNLSCLCVRRYRRVSTCRVSEIRAPEFKSQLSHLWAAWPWTRWFTALCLIFPSIKHGSYEDICPHRTAARNRSVHLGALMTCFHLSLQCHHCLQTKVLSINLYTCCSPAARSWGVCNIRRAHIDQMHRKTEIRFLEKHAYGFS